MILVENPYYKQMNNFFYFVCCERILENTWICSADNYFTENVFMEESENAFYASEYADGATEEWCIKTDNTGKNHRGSDWWRECMGDERSCIL